MIKKVWRALAVAGAAALCGTFSTATWSQTSGRFVAMERLQAQAAAQGKVRVIVALVAPSRVEPTLTPAEVVAQRQAIAQAQAGVGSRLAPLQGSVLTRYRTVPYLVAEVDANGLAALQASPQVRDVLEDELARPTLLESTALINADDAWAAGHTGTGWAVAVLDTGVERTHPFLNGKVVSEACYSTNGTGVVSLCPGGVSESTAVGSAAPCADICSHGTHVAGIAAGGTRSSNNMHGVAHGASIIGVQVFSRFIGYNSDGSDAVLAYTSDILKGLERVYELRNTYSIAAVNMSLGGGRNSTTCDGDARKAIIDNLRAAGIATVIAAGNNGYTTEISAPACISTAISVAASCDASSSSTCVTGVRGIASYSNVASFVSLVAPGSFIDSSILGGAYGSKNGTSMAAPHVAGAWAIIKKAQPTVSVTDALAQFRASAITVNDTRSGGSVTGLKHLDLAFLATPVTRHMLTVNRDGSAATSGTVTSSPAGISCGSDCSEAYDAGTSVTLTATPGSGVVFAGWSGACAGTSSCTLSMSMARAVTATFNTAPVTGYTLSVTKAGTGASLGTVNSMPAGIACGSDCSENYAAGTLVTLSATAASGAAFSGWSGACSGIAGAAGSGRSTGGAPANTCSVSMTAARSVTATFTSTAPTSYTLSVTKAGTAAAAGTVSSSPAGIACGSDCSEPYASGTTVTLTAAAGSGAVFAGWSGACTGTASTCTVTMSAARTVTATFDTAPVVTYLLSVSKAGTAAAAGTVSSSPAGIACGSDCSESYASGTSVTLTAAAGSGAVFAGWSGACTGTAATCTVTMSAARTVTATFDTAPVVNYLLSVNKAGTAAAAGTVSSNPAGIACGSDCSESYASGTTVTLTAAAGTGSAFAGWSGACTGTANTCTVSMSAARTVTATFNTVTSGGHTLSVAKTGGSAARGVVNSSPAGIACGTDCSESYAPGTSVTLSAASGRGTYFRGWGGACSGTNSNCTVTMDAAKSVTARFENRP